MTRMFRQLLTTKIEPSRILLLIAVLFMSAATVRSETPVEDVVLPSDTITMVKPDSSQIRPYDWYRSRYLYMGDWGKAFTVESEFMWPAGATRPDSSTLTPFQFWVSHMPLWHYGRGASSVRKGAVYAPNQISRAVRFPWRSSELSDRAIPLQILAEFLLMQNRRTAFRPITKAGDTLDYARFLKSSFAYGPRENIVFQNASVRPDSIAEFNSFFNLCAVNSTYRSLTQNADSIPLESLMPGDLIVAQNESGTKGSAHVVLVRLNRSNGESYFLIATGCEFACDFHIPLFNAGRREFPWLTLDQLSALGAEYPKRGAYRLRVP